MAKVYNIEKMMKNSFFRDYLANVSSDRNFSITSIMESLLDENKEYCDDKNYDHLCNIFCIIAIYKTLVNEGMNPKEAYDLVATRVWDYVAIRKSRYQAIYNMPFALKIANKVVPKTIAASSGYGWNYTWHMEQTPDLRFQYECTSCIYQQIFAKYQLPFLGPIFCHCDHLKYSDMPGVQFTRHHTLCNDGQPCDFLFTKKDNK